VNQHFGARDRSLDRVAHRVGELVGALEARAGAILDVQVDVAATAGPTSAQLVVAGQLGPPVRGDRLPDDVELVSGQRLVDERRGTVATAPTARAEDQTAESLVAAVPPLTAGVWRVEWQVFSTDGHVVTGSYQFRLAP